MLYMPRGTIHQAVAQEADSVHLTISTYQRWNHGELASRVMSHAAASTRSGRARLHACLMMLAGWKGLALRGGMVCQVLCPMRRTYNL